VHGTLEISSIIIAGTAGMILGNSILFPGTHTRKDSLKRGAKEGLKIIVALIPIFMVAAFLESFITRHTSMPVAVSISILALSLAFIVWYFIIYPIRVQKQGYRLNTEGKLIKPMQL
jgi:undecaprenyl pyrophosphate phosphatase UppP